MYYEIYIDVFFLINFMMDYLLLAATYKMQERRFQRRKVILGAFLGALLTCLLIMIPLPGGLRVFLCHTTVTSVMVITGLSVKTFRDFVKAFFVLYAGGFLLGGIFSFFSQYIRTGSLFFLFAVISYEVCQLVWGFWNQLHRHQEFVCEAVIENFGKTICMNALIDTGNSLTDPVTGAPVCIVEKEAVLELMEEDGKKRYISFRSVGNECSDLMLMKFDALYLHGKQEKEKHDIWIGISETRISSDGTYRMLVNPDIF